MNFQGVDVETELKVMSPMDQGRQLQKNDRDLHQTSDQGQDQAVELKICQMPDAAPRRNLSLGRIQNRITLARDLDRGPDHDLGPHTPSHDRLQDLDRGPDHQDIVPVVLIMHTAVGEVVVRVADIVHDLVHLEADVDSVPAEAHIEEVLSGITTGVEVWEDHQLDRGIPHGGGEGSHLGHL